MSGQELEAYGVKLLKKIFLVDLFQGLWVTFRNQHPKYIYTEQYPAERPKVAERYRGAPRLNINPDNGETLCIACNLCALACPETLIVVTSERNEETKPQGTDHLYLRHLALHVLRAVRGRLPGGRAGTDPGFRAGHLHARRPDLGPADAGGRAQAHAIQMLIDTCCSTSSRVLVLGGGILTITRRSAMHSAISLIVSLLGVAGLYLLQQAEFLFAVQIVLYVGGIMVLFLFVIMLVNLDEAAKERQFNGQWLVALAAALAVGARSLATSCIKGKDALPLRRRRRRRLPRGDRQHRADRRFAVLRVPAAV